MRYLSVDNKYLKHFLFSGIISQSTQYSSSSFHSFIYLLKALYMIEQW